MLKSKLKIYLPVILIVVFISVIYISLNNNPVSKASAIKINYDYPITDSLDTMSEAAELIVVGKIQDDISYLYIVLLHKEITDSNKNKETKSIVPLPRTKFPLLNIRFSIHFLRQRHCL